jgi:uncharacterized protein (DUF58 family)
LRTRLRGRLAAAAVAIVLGSVLALFATTGPAVAFFSAGLFLDIQVESPAHLVARGASVDVPVEITCNAEGPVFVSVTVTQRVGKGIAGGTGSAKVGCTGGGQDVVVRVPATVGGNAFTRGQAVADATIFGCRPNVCGSETDSETISIRR